MSDFFPSFSYTDTKSTIKHHIMFDFFTNIEIWFVEMTQNEFFGKKDNIAVFILLLS